MHGKLMLKWSRFVLSSDNMTRLWPKPDIPDFHITGLSVLSPFVLSYRSVSLAPKWVKFAQNGKNPGLFQARFRYILAHCAKIYRNLIWRSPGFFPFWANLTHFGTKVAPVLSFMKLEVKQSQNVCLPLFPSSLSLLLSLTLSSHYQLFTSSQNKSNE